MHCSDGLREQLLPQVKHHYDLIDEDDVDKCKRVSCGHRADDLSSNLQATTRVGFIFLPFYL